MEILRLLISIRNAKSVRENVSRGEIISAKIFASDHFDT